MELSLIHPSSPPEVLVSDILCIKDAFSKPFSSIVLLISLIFFSKFSFSLRLNTISEILYSF